MRNVKTAAGGERGILLPTQKIIRDEQLEILIGVVKCYDKERGGAGESPETRVGDTVGDAMYQKMLRWAGTLAVLRVCMCVMLCTGAE